MMGTGTFTNGLKRDAVARIADQALLSAGFRNGTASLASAAWLLDRSAFRQFGQSSSGDTSALAYPSHSSSASNSLTPYALTNASPRPLTSFGTGAARWRCSAPQRLLILQHLFSLKSQRLLVMAGGLIPRPLPSACLPFHRQSSTGVRQQRANARHRRAATSLAFPPR